MAGPQAESAAGVRSTDFARVFAMGTDLAERLTAATELIRSADNILFITGAGISADSGLPTYRGTGGLYNGCQTEDGISIEEALSAGMFRRRPEITWKYMSQIEAHSRQRTFNRGHEVLALFEQTKPRVWILTQNIDGFHRAAGSRNVIEIHGTMRRLLCTHCDFNQAVDSYEGMTIPPGCRSCGGMMRPAVVLFDEMLPEEATTRLQRELSCGFDLYVSIGTSSLFPYIISPILSAHRSGLPTIEINPAIETEISQLVTVHLPMRAAEALEAVARGLAE